MTQSFEESIAALSHWVGNSRVVEDEIGVTVAEVENVRARQLNERQGRFEIEFSFLKKTTTFHHRPERILRSIDVEIN